MPNPFQDGSSPSTMSSNDWWKTASNIAGNVLQSYTDIQVAKARSGIAAPAGVISSSPVNFPPGTQGRNAQAAGTPGGMRVPFLAQLGGANQRTMVYIGAAALLLLVVFMAKR